MIGKFLLKVIDVGDLPNLPVTVATDWWAIIVVGLLSGLGTVAGVYLGIRLSLKSFYSQKWWEKRSDAYGLVYTRCTQVLLNLSVLKNISCKEDFILRQKEYQKKYSEFSIAFIENMIFFNSSIRNAFTALQRELAKDHDKLVLNDNEDITNEVREAIMRSQKALNRYDQILNSEMKKDLNID